MRFKYWPATGVSASGAAIVWVNRSTMLSGVETSRVLAVLFLCGQQICRNSGYIFFATWFPTFLQRTRGISVETSGYLQGLVMAGTLVGALLGGALTDWVWRRTGNLRWSRSGVGAGSMAVCGLLMMAAWTTENVTLTAVLLSLGALSAALASPATFSAVIDIGGKRTSELMGLVNMCGNLSAAACPLVVGEIFARYDDWNVVLELFAALYLIGAVMWALVEPRRRRPVAAARKLPRKPIEPNAVDGAELNWSVG